MAIPLNSSGQLMLSNVEARALVLRQPPNRPPSARNTSTNPIAVNAASSATAAANATTPANDRIKATRTTAVIEKLVFRTRTEYFERTCDWNHKSTTSN